jgi:voltage-gated sodium channel
MQEKAHRLFYSKNFELFIISLIVINAIVLGLDTSESFKQRFGHLLEVANTIILMFFIVEAAGKIYSDSPNVGRYFRSGWNLFDFSVIVLSLIPASGQFAMIARTARLLRVLRLVSAIPELRLIVSTLIRTIPSMGNITLLMGVIFYIYAITGYHLFHQHDPQHWETLGLSLLTLFRIVTLEDWTDVMYTAMEMHPMAWVYFVSFVIIGTFVIINLFIAVVLNNLEEAKVERVDQLASPTSREEILRELKGTQTVLKRLEKRLESS